MTTRIIPQQEFLARQIMTKIVNPTHAKLSDQATDFLLALIDGRIHIETDDAGQMKVYGYEAIEASPSIGH